MSANRRGSDRELLHTLMPVSLAVTTTGGERVVSGCLFDVSVDGLSLILRDDLGVGVNAYLMLLHSRVPLRVAWSKRDGDRIYRCGLRCVDPDIDLRNLVSRHLPRHRSA